MDMALDTNIESSGLKIENFDVNSKLRDLNKGFDSNVQAKNGYYAKIDTSCERSIADWAGCTDKASIAVTGANAMDHIKDMFSGKEVDGKYKAGLSEINRRYNNTDKSYASLKQQSGYTAEIINATKENIRSMADGSDIRTLRTDDISKNATGDLVKYTQNDPYVDLVRVDGSNNVVERVQVKYVGKDASDCLSKLTSKKYEKYLDPSKVDKMQIPQEYYSDIKQTLLPEKMASLEKEIAYCKENGKTDIAETKSAQLEKLKILDDMLEEGASTSAETMNATKHPKIYAAKLLAMDTVKAANVEGLNQAKVSAVITGCISTVDNISKVYTGEIEIDDAVVNIVKDTGTSAALAYGTGFVTGAVSTLARESSHQLIRQVGGSCLPGAVVSLAIESYDDVSAFTKGEIDEYEFAEKMGGNVSSVAGALGGAAIGQAVIPIPVVGAVVGGVVGCAVASETYESVVEFVKEDGKEIIENVAETAEVVVEAAVEVVVDSAEVVVEKVETAVVEVQEGLEELADTAKELADNTVEAVSEVASEAVDSVKGAFNDFSKSCSNLFSFA